MNELSRLALKPHEHGIVWDAIKNSGYKWENSRWVKGLSKLTQDLFSQKIMNADWMFSPRQTLELISDIERHWNAILQIEKEKLNAGTRPHKDWINKWVELLKSRFSIVDEIIWNSLAHAVDENGATMCVCRTGRGTEYRIVGKKPEEIIDWMAGMTVDGSNQTRLGYIEDMIVGRIMEHTMGYFGEETTDISILDGSILSAAAAGELYDYAAVQDATGQLCGYRLRQKKKITALGYIEASLESFLARMQYRIRNIKTISNDPAESCYLYIPLTGEDGPWDEWDLWMRESFAEPTAKDAFMGWLGALLDAKNTGKQCLWLHGRGNDGKSKIADCLRAFFGNSYAGLNNHSMKNQFGAAKLENKRLVILSDSKNQKLLQSEWAHLLTGGDATDIERKGKNSYTAKLGGKLAVFANYPPEIKTDEANQRSRLLYIRIKKRTDSEALAKGLAVLNDDGEACFVGSSDWPERMSAQLPAFLNECCKVYKRVAPTGSDIITSKAMRLEMESMCADPIADNIASMCDAVFEFEKDALMRRSDALVAMRMVQREYGLNVDNTFTVSEVYSYLYNTFGATRTTAKMEGFEGTQRCITNIKLRSEAVNQGL